MQNKQQPKISIVIPVFNAENYLHECLDSVVNQTLQEIEIICVDDGSTDGSLTILQEYEAKDDRVRVLSQTNCGVSVARNNGICAATGKYIGFIDADDYIDMDTYETAYDLAEKEGADIAVFGGSCFPAAGWADSKLSTRKKTYMGDSISPLFNEIGSRPFIFNKIYRSALFSQSGLRFDETLKLGEDLALMFDLFPLAKTVVYMPNKFYHYRQHTDSSMSSFNRDLDHKIRLHMKIVRHIYSTWEERGYSQKYGTELCAWIIQFLSGDLKNCRYNFKLEAYREIVGMADKLSNSQFLPEKEKAEYDFMRKLIETPYVPRVSIIMPSLNVAPYIRECMDSVVNQTLCEIEILCVDAGSTDGTLEVLEDYAAQDNRITIIHSEKKSYGYQINLGIDAANGEYIGIVETDDYIERDMYRVLSEIADRYHLDLLRADFMRFWGEGEERCFLNAHVALEPEHYNVVLDPFEDNKVFQCENQPWTGIYRTSFLKEKQIRLHESPGASYQDNGLWWQTFTQTHRLMNSDYSFYRLRRDNPNSSANSREKVYCMCEEYDFIRNFLHQHTELETRFAPLLAVYRMRNYDYTLNRIAPEYKREFLQRYAEDFRSIRQNGELDESLFTKQQWKRLNDLMECPEFIYYLECYQDGRIMKKMNQLDRLQYDLDCVHASASYRLGRVMTWLPRKVRGGIRCYREHGLRYTGERLLIHLHVKVDPNKILD